MNQTFKGYSFPSGQRLELAQGDITEEKVDAIVNAANSHLIHGGGVAGVIARKGGRVLQAESSRWVEEHGPVTHAEPAVTVAGELPCRYVIHAVGPVWGEGDEDAKLSAAIQGSVKAAEKLGLASLSIPAISTGIFGFPKERAAQVMLTTLLTQLATMTSSSLKLIRIVLYDAVTAQAFVEAWEQNDHLGA